MGFGMFDSLSGDFGGTHQMAFIPNEILFAEVFQRPKKKLDRKVTGADMKWPVYAYLVLLT